MLRSAFVHAAQPYALAARKGAIGIAGSGPAEVPLAIGGVTMTGTGAGFAAVLRP